MVDVNKTRIQLVEDWLTESGYLFKKSVHSNEECIFLIYEDAVYQAELLFELTINDNTSQINLEKVINECEKLSFIHHSCKFNVIDESVNAMYELEAKTNKDFIAEILVKDANDSSLINLNYVIFNGAQ